MSRPRQSPSVSVRFDLEDLIDQLLPRLVERLPQRAPEAAPPRYLTSTDVAKRGGWPTRKAFEMMLVRARKRGEMHALERMAIQVDGGGRRWLESDFNKWVEAQR